MGAPTLAADTLERPIPSRHVLRLHPHRSAPSLARHALRTCASLTDLPTAVVDDAAFAVGELMLISARECHTGSLTVIFEIDDASIVIRVADEAVNRSAMQLRSNTTVERAWSVVRRVASSWGVAASGDGRQLWARLESPRLAH
jgi:hypothetical protein